MNTNCILRGSDDGLALDLTDGETFTCEGCNASFAESDIMEQIKGLRRLLRFCLAAKSEEAVEA